MNTMFKNFAAAFLSCFLYVVASGQSQFIIQSGTELKLSAGSYMVLENTHFTNNGTLNLAGISSTFKFSGNTSTDISGSSQPVFSNIQIAKTGSAQLVLQRDIDTRGTLSFVTGILHLNNHVVNLSNSGALNNESESSRAIGPAGGYIQWSDVLNAPSSANPGNLGLIISTTQNLGSTVIRRGHQSQVNSSGGGASILRYFDISPTNNSGLNASLQMNYFDAEKNGLTESNFGLWKSAVLPTWSYVGYDARDATANYVYKAGISSFSRWTISTINNPLPVHFSLFNTKCENNYVVVRWITETEINTSYFEIQRSGDGINWTTIANMTAAGNSSTSRQYSYADHASISNGYYRIISVDMDGRKNYTTINQARCDQIPQFRLWPNPATDKTWLSVTVPANKRATLKFFDSKGAVIYSRAWELFAGNNIIDISIATWPAGSYTAQLIYDEEIKSIKILKQ